MHSCLFWILCVGVNSRINLIFPSLTLTAEHRELKQYLPMEEQLLPSPPSFPLLLLARTCSLLVFFLVLYWALLFNSSFHPRPSLASSDLGLTYAVLHPLFMVIGFILITGEAILVHRWFPGSSKVKKSVHLWLHGLALACGVFGIWTKFSGIDGVVSNFYSLHSWMGLVCISLFTAQWMMGFRSFWHRGEARSTRTKVLPWHVFLGLYTYGLAVATAETGLLEKLTLLQAGEDAARRSPESMVVNGLGLGLALLSGVVILTAVSPKYQGLRTKLIYSCPESKKT